MSCPVQCPGCGDKFYVHGFERSYTCANCGRTFNPQTNALYEMERAEVDER